MELPRVATRARLVALAALAVAAVVVVVLLLMRSSYHVNAVFTNASQLVKGDRVTVAGEPIGTVHDITLTPDGQAKARMDIDGKYAPLRRGTRAIVRQASLSGEANRHIELELAPNGAPDISSGGELPPSATPSSVEPDQLFDTFDQPTRAGAQRTVRLLRDAQRGREREAGEALSYLDPAL